MNTATFAQPSLAGARLRPARGRARRSVLCGVLMTGALSGCAKPPPRSSQTEAAAKASASAQGAVFKFTASDSRYEISSTAEPAYQALFVPLPADAALGFKGKLLQLSFKGSGPKPAILTLRIDYQGPGEYACAVPAGITPCDTPDRRLADRYISAHLMGPSPEVVQFSSTSSQGPRGAIAAVMAGAEVTLQLAGPDEQGAISGTLHAVLPCTGPIGRTALTSNNVCADGEPTCAVITARGGEPLTIHGDFRVFDLSAVHSAVSSLLRR